MPWLSSYSDTNLIIDEYNSWTDFISFAVQPGETPPRFKRVVTQTKKRYVGMTYAAAVSCQTALHNPPSVEASVSREGDGGAYTVNVMEITRADWEAVT